MVRIFAALAALLALVACNHTERNNEAIRQAVVDRLSQPGLGLNLAAMDVKLASVQVTGEEADATVSLTLKDAKDMPGMTMKYHLRQQDSKWVVVGLAGGGDSPHGAGGPATASPHGSGAPAEAPGGAGKMPSPGDLPPAGTGK